MPELIRQDTEYAMRALVYLALNNQEKFVTVKALAQQSHLPADFAHKILRHLTKSGLTRRQMGRHGGFKLTLKPEEITLAQVVSAIQGSTVIKRCCTDPGVCPTSKGCGFLPALKALQDRVIASLNCITLAEVVKQESDLNHK
jgi:Rrf2 family protein